GTPLIVTEGDELKLVVPQAGLTPEMFEALRFRVFSLQPMDGPDRLENTRLATNLCLSRPQWRLSLQTHKQIGIR
ncbi:MAG TPA: 7-carboxy-7-deazaguanine synthase, partial [Rhodopila sp.]|nr:7-carboxy-7-deazaguanine synthase [Rhodopila sp.]